MTPSPDIIARHPSGDWFVLRGRGCLRQPVSRHATEAEARLAANWSEFPAVQA